MASRFPAHWLDELRSRSDIVQVVSSYVGLKKSGRKYWGLCPFHGEKTASFSVDEEQQLYYCFGCKAGGNVISFIMDMERCSFHEAVEFLAERAHIPLPEMEDDPEWEKRRTRRERLLSANREAAKFYHEMLFRPEGRSTHSSPEQFLKASAPIVVTVSGIEICVRDLQSLKTPSPIVARPSGSVIPVRLLP